MMLVLAEESVQEPFSKQIGHRFEAFRKHENLDGRDCGRDGRLSDFH